MKTDLDLVKERLEYLPEEDPTRVFKWKFSNNQKKKSSFNTRCAGKWAGSIDKEYGYISISLNGKPYDVHRLVYMIENNIEHFKDIPAYIDHIDRNPVNNHPSNLRSGANGINQRNRASLGCINYKGVDKRIIKGEDRYRSRIVVNNREVSLGYYSTAEEAASMYDMACIFCGLDIENSGCIGEYQLLDRYKTKLEKTLKLPKLLTKKSKLLGISWSKKQQKFNTVIWNLTRNYCSGSFTDEVEAALSRNKFILENPELTNNHLTYFDNDFQMFTINNCIKVYS